jgi:hypothetical protein
MPPAYVKPYVKRHKNDAVDAEAIRVADAATHEGRGHRTSQQDRQDGVGDDGQGGTLQRTSRTRGLNEITPDIRRDVKVLEGEQRVMQSRSIRRSGQPTWARALSNASC